MKKLLILLSLSIFVFANDAQDFYKLIEKLEKKELTNLPKVQKVQQKSTNINIKKLYTLKGIYSLNGKIYALIEKKSKIQNSVRNYCVNNRIDNFKIESIVKQTNSVILKNNKTQKKYTLKLN